MEAFVGIDVSKGYAVVVQQMRYTCPVSKICIWERSAFHPPVLFSCNLCTELLPSKGKMYGSFLAALAWEQFRASKGIQEE